MHVKRSARNGLGSDPPRDGYFNKIIYAWKAVRKRQPVRLLISTLLFAISFSLLFLHMFGFISIWPPVADWTVYL